MVICIGSIAQRADALTISNALKARAYLLLGGFVGVDGYLTSSGMYQLKYRLDEIPDLKCIIYTWDQYKVAAADASTYPDDKIIVIGYSGGGTRATWWANLPSLPVIDLMILYDPSPYWQMMAVGDNVKKAICYHNNHPWFFGFGGGRLKGPNVETIEISENHLLVQNDKELNFYTIDKIKEFMKDAVDTKNLR